MIIRKMRHFLSIFLSCVVLWNCAPAQAETFQLGKDYITFPTRVLQETQPKGAVMVQEFFSYECPACFAADPTIQAWVNTHPAHIAFSRVPVVFRSTWEPYARAYYVAQQLGIQPKIHTPFFNAIHVQHQSLNTETEIATFFAHYGVTAEAVHKAWNSAETNQNLILGERRMLAYQINQIPAMVIGGTYRVDASMVDGDPKKMLAVVQFLVAKLSAH